MTTATLPGTRPAVLHRSALHSDGRQARTRLPAIATPSACCCVRQRADRQSRRPNCKVEDLDVDAGGRLPRPCRKRTPQQRPQPQYPSGRDPVVLPVRGHERARPTCSIARKSWPCRASAMCGERWSSWIARRWTRSWLRRIAPPGSGVATMRSSSWPCKQDCGHRRSSISLPRYRDWNRGSHPLRGQGAQAALHAVAAGNPQGAEVWLKERAWRR